MIKRIGIVCVLLLAGAFSPLTTVNRALADSVFYVDADATGSNNGTSWANAFTSLQDALLAASDGDEIWVAEGIYYPDEGAGLTDNDPTVSFVLGIGEEVYGGFNGTETDVSQRNPAANVTVLSGDIDQNDTFNGNNVTTSLGGIVPDATTATGTWANNSGNSLHVVVGSNTTAATVLDGFTITAGNADGFVAPDDLGGGMFINSGNPTLTNLVFSGNRARFWGGGIEMTNGVTSTLTNVTFVGNFAERWGGGVDSNEFSAPTFIDVTFVGNAASVGGGLANFESSPTLTNVRFHNNSASIGGGAIRSENQSNISVTNALFTGNTADEGGALLNSVQSVGEFTNVTITGNTADVGGGISNESDSDISLTNVILSGNTAFSSGDQMANEMADPRIAYSLIEGSGGSGSGWDNAFGVDDGNNIDASPLFQDLNGGDDVLGTTDDSGLLFGCSPGVDAGDTAAVPSGVTTDLAGNPRTDGPVDMGAYEIPGGLDCIQTDEAPSDLTATYNSGPHNVSLSWTDNSGSETGFVVERQKQGSGAWQQVGTVSPNTTTLTDETVTCDQLYTYRVYATQGGTISEPAVSNDVSTECNIFVDVPSPNQPAAFEQFIEDFYQAGITTGCNAGTPGVDLRYCPDDPVTRGSMALFIIRALEYPDLPHTPQGDPGQTFADVPSPNQPPIFEDWIEEFLALGITQGCAVNPLRYCPETPVTRGDMAVFIMRALEADGYTPTGNDGQTFTDVPSPTQPPIFEAWIEEFYNRGITTGCNAGTPGEDLAYCPNDPVTRGAMAVFLLRAFEEIPGPDSP